MIDAYINEANQLGLNIYWCGENRNGKIEGYDVEAKGAFSYTVKKGIEFMDFAVEEDDEVYCTGIIIRLPEGFTVSDGVDCYE